MLNKYKQNKPNIVPFAECPSCHRLINLKSITDAYIVGSRNCSFCGVFIDKKEIISSCDLYLKLTKAIQSGRDILSFNWALYVIFGFVFLEMLFLYSSKDLFGLSVFFVIIFSIVLFIGGSLKTEHWLAKYGLIQTDEDEYLVIRKRIGQTRKIWLLANIVNLVLWLIFIKFF